MSFEAVKCMLLFWSLHPLSILMCTLTDWNRVLYEMCKVLCQTEETAHFSCIFGGLALMRVATSLSSALMPSAEK